MRKSSISGVPLRVRNENLTAYHRNPSRERSSSIGRSSFGAGPSKMTVASQRNSTASSQFSFLPKIGRPSSGIGVRGRTDVPKDPRPIQDKKYQNQLIKQLLEFLVQNQYPHPISPKILGSPSGKDFFKIFEFIFSKICHGYKQVPKMEEEVPRLLKQLGYPFSFSKTHLLSVGSPHTWPNFLAALVWMIDLIQLSKYIDQHGGIDTFIFKPTGEEFDGISEEKILFDYCEKTYEAFLHGADSYEEQEKALREILRAKYQVEDIQNLRAENARLEEELKLTRQTDVEIEKLREAIEVTKHDKKLLQDYTDKMQHYRKAQESEVAKKQEELEMLRLNIKAETEKLAYMQEIYKKQDLSPTDVERLKAEQEGLKKQVETLEKQIASIDSDNWETQLDQAKYVEKVEREAAEYNRLAISLKLVPETAELANGKDFRLSSGVSSDPVAAFENTVKPMLTLMKKTGQDALRSKDKIKFQLQYENEQFLEELSDINDKVSKMENELKCIEAEIDSMKQNFQTDKKSLSDDIVSLQETIVHLEALHKQAEKERMRLQEEYKSRCLILNSKRKEVNDGCAELEGKWEQITKEAEEYKKVLTKCLDDFVSRLQAANTFMDDRLLQAEAQRKEWEELLNSSGDDDL